MRMVLKPVVVVWGERLSVPTAVSALRCWRPRPACAVLRGSKNAHHQLFSSGGGAPQAQVPVMIPTLPYTCTGSGTGPVMGHRLTRDTSAFGPSKATASNRVPTSTRSSTTLGRCAPVESENEQSRADKQTARRVTEIMRIRRTEQYHRARNVQLAPTSPRERNCNSRTAYILAWRTSGLREPSGMRQWENPESQNT